MRLKLEKLEEADIEPVAALFSDIIDEIHVSSSEVDRMQFKRSYSVKSISKAFKTKNSVYLVGKVEDKVVCFFFGGITECVGNIYWLGVTMEEREKGYGTKLIGMAIDEFKARDCHEVKLFTFQRIGLRIFEKWGFKDITYINKNIFGVNLVQMVLVLKTPDKESGPKSIIISGEAGQGIKLVSHSLAKILNKLGMEVVLNLRYDAGVMGGSIIAELIYSKEKIMSPFLKEADIAVQLSKNFNPDIRAKKMVIEESVKGFSLKDNERRGVDSDRVPFKTMSTEQFQSTAFVNMIALGRLLKLIGVEISQVNFAAEFPKRSLDKNIKAVRYGYSHRDWR